MEKELFIYVDGKFYPKSEAKISVYDHGLLYGDGVFEGIKAYNGSVFRLKEHIDRLYKSAHTIMLQIPMTKEEMTKAVIETLKKNNLKEGYIRPLIFVGDGVMGVHPGKNPIRVSIITWPWGAYLGEEALERGIRTKVSSYNRHHVNVMMTKAKISGNYVNSVLAKREVVRMGYDEAIMLDTEGYVSEATGENVFMVKNGVLKTTPLTSVLPGITRDCVMYIARTKRIPLVEERFTRDELYVAHEAFLTGTAAEVTPIREVDDRKIGEGKPGPITREIQASYFDIVKGRNPDTREWLDYL